MRHIFQIHLIKNLIASYFTINLIYLCRQLVMDYTATQKTQSLKLNFTQFQYLSTRVNFSTT